MTKNITLSLSDNLAEKMESMPEVNWSSVARKAIKQYIEWREQPDLTELLEKLQRQKGEEYIKGRMKADAVANELGYKKLNLLLKDYNRKVDDTNQQNAMGPIPPWESLPSPDEIMYNIMSRNKFLKEEVADAFIEGLTDRLKEIEKAL